MCYDYIRMQWPLMGEKKSEMRSDEREKRIRYKRTRCTATYTERPDLFKKLNDKKRKAKSEACLAIANFGLKFVDMCACLLVWK